MSKWIGERTGLLYEVFGRAKADEPLAHIGSLTAPNLMLAKARAKMMYAEREWLELSIAPADAFTRLVGAATTHPVGFA
jgi:hypothetical protein